MNPRSSVGQIEREISGAKPVRGDFIKDVRADDTLDGSVNTIDDGDLVYGRLALVVRAGSGPEREDRSLRADRPGRQPVPVELLMGTR